MEDDNVIVKFSRAEEEFYFENFTEEGGLSEVSAPLLNEPSYASRN